jgi:curved DNA-binding protein CbpA
LISQRITQDERNLFVERIGRGLEERPLDLGVEAHRVEVAGLLRKLGEESLYHLLAIDPTASAILVHEAYERIARLVHPAHAGRLGLGGREEVLDVLFERVTLAYLTLSHPGRRREYDREFITAGGPRPGGKPRADEQRERARGNFNRAVTLAAAEDYHFAIELLRDAVRVDPRAEYFALLGELQAKNVHWLRHAAESYARALELGGPAPELEAALVRVRERLAAGEDVAARGAGAGKGRRQREGDG